MQRLSTFSMMAAMVRRDLQSALRRGSEWSNPLLFFVMVCTLFPLGVGPEREQLAALAPGVIWVVALLASMMATDSLFRGDHDDATLEQLLLSPVPLYPLVLAKTLTHWMLSGLPLSLLSPLLGMLLQLPPAGYGVLMLSLLLGLHRRCHRRYRVAGIEDFFLRHATARNPAYVIRARRQRHVQR